MKNKYYLIPAVLIFIIMSFVSYGQEKDKKLVKTEYVLNIIKTTYNEKVIVIGNDIKKEYDKAWLASAKIESGMLVFNYKEVKHTWDIESAIMIEKNKDVLYIRFF